MNNQPTKYSSIIKSRLQELRIAWNRQDLNELVKFISTDIVCISPAVNLGFIKLPGREIQGTLKMLKMWQKYFNDFDTYEEGKDFLSIEATTNGYLTKCMLHYPRVGVSCHVNIFFEKDFMISKFDFRKISSYRQMGNASSLKIISKYVQRKFKKREIVGTNASD